MDFYHEAMRELQDRYEGRAVADRLEERLTHSTFIEDDRRMIGSAAFFFLATASHNSVDCSFKGGEPGFERVVGDSELIWPDYDGNRMYRSLGNIGLINRVGLVFISFDGHRDGGSAARLRVNGRATIDESADAVVGLPGAKRLVRVSVDHKFPNCPRYIPKIEIIESSKYAPRNGHSPPEPEWKQKPFVKDIFDEEKG